MKRSWLTAIFILLVLPIIWLSVNFIHREPVHAVVIDSVTYEISTPKPLKKVYGWVEDSVLLEERRIKWGENMADILASFGLPTNTIHSLSYVPREVFNPRRIKARNPYTVIYNNDSARMARSLIYHENKIEFIQFNFSDSLQVFRGKHEVDTVENVITGDINTSLYQSILDAGSSPVLVNDLADIYAWVIDFFGLQKGDQFKVIFEEYRVNGEVAEVGRIKAAEFTHSGQKYYAFLYDQGEGFEYYDEKGKSLRKTLLKAPLNYSRISSKFSYSRLHPILKIRRPHTGIDYAAPKGTPVQSVGDGVILQAAYKGGGGNTIKIRHNSNYTTAYLHLAGFAKGIRKGVQVKQGQIIGYVGSTGLSTGPHLDFRFWKNGVPVDPLKIDPPSANPIRNEKVDQYLTDIEEMKMRLDAIKVQKNYNLIATQNELEGRDDV